MGKFSKEWIIQECVVKNHCLGVSLKRPVNLGGNGINRFYVTDVLVENEQDREAMSRNLMSGQNTFHGTISVKAFTESPADTRTFTLNLDDIDSIMEIN